VNRCRGAQQLQSCIDAELQRYRGAQVHRCIGLGEEVQSCRVAEVSRGEEVKRCRVAELQSCRGAEVHVQSELQRCRGAEVQRLRG